MRSKGSSCIRMADQKPTSAANGTVASISQFISITSLIQGGVTGATRVAFYGPVATGDMKKASVVYKTSQSFYTKFALALTGYVVVLAVVYPKFVETPFGYIDVLLLVLVLGMSSVCLPQVRYPALSSGFYR